LAIDQATAEGFEDVALDDRVRGRAADHHEYHAVDELVALGLLGFPSEEIVDGLGLGQD
jgi:hypothetical protein